ncbi:response regulator [Anabaena sp. FACHB-1237]|uniref:response regulator n=1 Tax=Anabaena sp. FACHB-1237 TaxID=2692769 RepID=UPI0016817726|nr:response regulator [Anabaena sp. FACHB-1237]MBD2138568.1 response regulator [Anabaena sp. FACHB-1237]
MKNTGSFTHLSPQGLLRQLSNCCENTYVRVLSNSVYWLIYIESGKIIYATYSVESFDRLERVMRSLSPNIPLVASEIRAQMRLQFEGNEQNEHLLEPPEYAAISWLVAEKHLLFNHASLLIQELIKETIYSFLLIKFGSYELDNTIKISEKYCRLDVNYLLEYSEDYRQIWQQFLPYVYSPYQRPYLLISRKFEDKKLPPLPENLTNWMKGFSLRHLAIIMDEDELQLLVNLYPYIVKGSIVLHEPDPPFDKLPKIADHQEYLSKTDLVRGKSFVINESPILRKVIPTQTTVTVPQQLIEQPIEPPIEQSIIAKVSEEVTPQSLLINVTNEGELESDQEFSLATVTNSIELDSEKVNENTKIEQKIYKIISVDDSPTILKEISRCLENENFSLVTINEPVKAVMSIIRHKPDLILLDLNMAGIDGYELCRIIRNNSMFKKTPIIFVTGNKGIIDKVKAKFVGASGYLTKPFTRAQLLKIIFMHLT